jgi:hypothetical protein
MPKSAPCEEIVSKLVIIRLALAGALVAVSVAELAGLTTSPSGQFVAGSFGVAAVYGLKLAHLL